MELWREYLDAFERGLRDPSDGQGTDRVLEVVLWELGFVREGKRLERR